MKYHVQVQLVLPKEDVESNISVNSQNSSPTYSDTSDSSISFFGSEYVSRTLDLELSGIRGSQETIFDMQKKSTGLGSAKGGSVSQKVSDGTSNLGKTSGIAKESEFFESGTSSVCRGSDVSDESTCSSFSGRINKPHKANDIRWEAIQAVRSRDGALGLSHFNLGS